MKLAPALAIGLAAGCGPPGDPLDINYTLTTGAEQTCEAEGGGLLMSCSDVPMTCESVVLLRIVDPDHPQTVYIDECVPIPRDGPATLCALTRATFSGSSMRTMPTSLVEVQIAIYPRTKLPEDLATGLPICPAAVSFTGTGFARPDNDPVPALAGRAFADGYDDEITVELGCQTLRLIDSPECRNENAIDISASINDFDTSVSISDTTARMQGVRVGEPTQSGLDWVLNLGSTKELAYVMGPTPSFHANDLDITFNDNICIQVLEDTPQSTASLTCRPAVAPIPSALDLTGVRVAKTTLTQVITALGNDLSPPGQFPAAGMVLGIVIDETGAPVPGVTVTDSEVPAGSTTIKYLSADRTTTAGLTQTSASGIFISLNAPFVPTASASTNVWRAMGTTMQQRTFPVGGNVLNRLTVIVIHLEP